MIKIEDGMTKHIVLFTHTIYGSIRHSSIRVYDATDVADLETTIKNDVPHVVEIVDAWVDDDITEVDWSTLAFSKRTNDYILDYTFSDYTFSKNGDVMQMVIRNCKNEKEAEEGFRCMFNDPESHIEGYKIWDWKYTNELEKGYNVLTLQNLRDYRDGK